MKTEYFQSWNQNWNYLGERELKEEPSPSDF
jgi:hypothetical protein